MARSGKKTEINGTNAQVLLPKGKTKILNVMRIKICLNQQIKVIQTKVKQFLVKIL
jgi:hypothetical protein